MRRTKEKQTTRRAKSLREILAVLDMAVPPLHDCLRGTVIRTLDYGSDGSEFHRWEVRATASLLLGRPAAPHCRTRRGFAVSCGCAYCIDASEQPDGRSHSRKLSRLFQFLHDHPNRGHDGHHQWTVISYCDKIIPHCLPFGINRRILNRFQGTSSTLGKIRL